MVQQNRKLPAGIALCLSGGGYKAAAFHLGVLTYLHRIQVLQQVEILSTVSGGTLTGLAYTYSLKKGKSFEEFYFGFRDFLSSVNLVKLSLANIGRRSDTAQGFRNLITSIADVYDEKMFSGDRFILLWQEPAIHLQEIIFNATEFRTGVDFRFLKSQDDEAKIGNGNVNISLADAQKIRLADIAAASSCFPGGFEPLAFPYDFRWPGNVIPPSLTEEFVKALPLLDGGVYDNQGIDAALLAIERRKKGIPLFIISDTDQKNGDIYTYPQKKSTRSLSLNTFNRILQALMVLSLISSVVSLVSLWISLQRSIEWILAFFAYGFPAIVLGSLAFGINWLRDKVNTEVLNRIPKLKLAAWKDIKHLTIDQVIEMASLRATSLFALASTVFMKRIRSLVFARIYNDKKYDDKRVSNLIYKLDETRKPRVDWLKPSAEIQAITHNVENMPTTLWFDDPRDLQKLIACGEYTICYNLIDYIIRSYGQQKAKYPAWVNDLFERLVEDWKKFERDPMMMSG